MTAPKAGPEPPSVPSELAAPPTTLEQEEDGATGSTKAPVAASAISSITVDNASAGLADVEASKSKELEDVATASSSTAEKTPAFVERKRDFWIIPIPKKMRYHPDRPFHFSLATNYLFAFASTFTVANLSVDPDNEYYCQPLQVQYSISFDVSYSAATHVPAVLQGGYAGGLLLITPLGDMVRRRGLTLLLIFITTVLSIGLAVGKTWEGFLALNFLTGLFTVAPQVMIPLAADLSPPNRRAQCMAIVLSGLLMGILVARVLSGIIAQYASWRVVYYMAIGAQSVIWAALYFAMPDYPAKNPDLSYLGAFVTMGKFLVTNPVLVQGSITSGLGSAIFTSFWVTLTFLLSEDPYNYNTLIIGLFGLVGMTGVCTAPFVGKSIDRIVPWCGVVLGNLLLTVSNLLLLGGAQTSIGFIIVAIFIMDIGQQFQQVANQSRIFATNPQAGARLNSVYIIGLFIGQLIGSSLSSRVFLEYGARPYYGLNLGMIGFSLLVLAARGPVFNNKKWLGWGKRNEWAVLKPKVKKAVDGDQEMGLKASGEKKPPVEASSEGSEPVNDVQARTPSAQR